MNKHRNACYGLGIFLIAFSQITAASDIDLFELSLEELMQMPVEIASKKEQSLLHAPAAVTVLTAEDIQRSGLTSLPEVLRLIPGATVSRYDANKWAISIRGFSNRFANQLLVLMDGRTLYSPLFSGTYWDAQDVVLNDIERIEVVRGSGGTLWGANAVNGVINIITKSAKTTQGTLVDATVGDTDTRELFNVRSGFMVGTLPARLYFIHRNMDSGEIMGPESGNLNYRPVGEQANDEWHKQQMGGRIENACDELCWNTAFDVNRARLQQSRIARPAPQQPLQAFDDEITSHGWNINQVVANPKSVMPWKAQFYMDHNEREDASIKTDIDKYNLEFHQTISMGADANSTLTYGGQTQFTDIMAQGKTSFIFSPEQYDEERYNVFAQWDKHLFRFDESLLQGDVFMTLGSKLEKVSAVGSETLPNLRLRWEWNEKHLLWSSISEAVRQPSYADRFAAIAVGNLITPIGNPSLTPEKMQATELGYRGVLHEKLSVDLALYEHDYTDLIANNHNDNELGLRGYEAVVSWRPLSSLSVQANYNHQYAYNEGATAFRNSPLPRDAGSININWRILHTVEFNLYHYYSDKLRTTAAGVDVGNINRVDANVQWTPSPTMTFALIFQNINDPVHFENIDTQRLSSGVERSAMARVLVRY